MAELSKKNQYFFEFMPIQLRWTPPRSKHKRKTLSKGAIKFFLYLGMALHTQTKQKFGKVGNGFRFNSYRICLNVLIRLSIFIF